jgi:hypothetical protein
MKRLALALAIWLAALSPALATTLLNLTVTTAIPTSTTVPLQVRRPTQLNSILIHCVLQYGSGGTTVDAWIQTSIDGSFWMDVAQCHGALTNLSQYFNLHNQATVTTPLALTDGTLAANTSVAGIVGPWWRVKYSSTGTYAGNTKWIINVSVSGGLGP